MKDPIVEEIRNIRHEIEKEYNNDTKALIKHILKSQKKHKGKLVSRKTRLLSRKKVA